MKKGLEGVEAAESKLSFIDGKQKNEGFLMYVGYTIDDLVHHTCFEEVVYLLFNNELPTSSQLRSLKSTLRKERKLPKEIIAFMKKLPKKSSHMSVLRTTVSLLAFYDKSTEDMSEKANRQKALRLVARVPTIIAAWERIRQGKAVIQPHATLDHAENFLYMFFGKKAKKENTYVFDKWLIMHADHTLNASTFSARVTIATMSDMYSAITSAVGTLKGPLHGGANQRVMKMLLEIKEEKNVVPYITRLLKRHERIMGIGHRVYKTGDPRARLLCEVGEPYAQTTQQKKWFQIAKNIETLCFNKIGLKPNVDFYSAVVLYNLGFPIGSYPPLFAAGRIAGWTAHVLEQELHNRLIRPKVVYIGPKKRRFIPLEKRK